ncbi:MAG: hypothetical protein KDD45_02415 [Bdellovibrionales bacterium]|nr:hypothetical protein [Bdellovibrionales bacterium]
MAQRYINQEDAKMRLKNTYILFENKVCFVADVSSSKCYLVFSNGSDKEVSYNDDRIDLETFKLGFINFDNAEAIFIQRFPYRMQKQGLCLRTSINFSLSSNKNINLHPNNSMCMSIENLHKQKYPSFSESLKRTLSGKNYSSAFSINGAINRISTNAGLIFYKSSPIYIVNHKKQLFKPIGENLLSIRDKDLYETALAAEGYKNVSK